MENTDTLDRASAPDDDAPHLLVVDDDTRIRNLLRQYLTENGFRVTVAGNAGEARRKLAGLDFDMLVLDIMMPGESGVDLTKALRAEKKLFGFSVIYLFVLFAALVVDRLLLGSIA